METFQVKIGSAVGVYWGQYEVKTTDKLKEIITNSIEVLHPLNSSDEGAELYRQRFRGKPIFIKKPSEKEFKQLI